MGLFDWAKGKKKDEHDDADRPDFSNVRSGASTVHHEQEGASGPVSGTRVYTVESGDSLWKIAEKFYGDGSQWRKIHEANRATIDDPDVIHPGQQLTIPE